MALLGHAGFLGLLLIGTRWSRCTFAISVSPQLGQQRNMTVLQLGSGSLERASQELVAAARGECKLCHLGGPQAKVLYFRRRHDSLGEQVMSLIYGMAMASKCGLNFGGAYTTYRKKETAGQIDVLTSTADLFSVRPEELFVEVADLVELLDAHIVHFMDDLPDKVARDPLRKTFIVHQAVRGTMEQDETVLSAPSFREALREQAQPFLQRRLARNSAGLRPAGAAGGGGPVVAVHIRSGVEPKDPQGRWKTWYTPQEWFDTVVGQIRGLMPNASIHAFGWFKIMSKEENAHLYGNFPERLGVQLHDVNSNNMLDALAELAAADVLVTAKTDYSQVAALLNPNCVVFNYHNKKNQRFYDKRWIKASEMALGSEAERLRVDLKNCMRERFPHYKLAD